MTIEGTLYRQKVYRFGKLIDTKIICLYLDSKKGLEKQRLGNTIEELILNIKEFSGPSPKDQFVNYTIVSHINIRKFY